MFAKESLTALAQRRAQLRLRIGDQRQVLALRLAAVAAPVRRAEHLICWWRRNLALLPAAALLAGTLFGRKRKAGAGLGTVLLYLAPAALGLLRRAGRPRT